MRFAKRATAVTRVCLHGIELGLVDALPAMILEAHHHGGDLREFSCGVVQHVRTGREWTVRFHAIGEPFKVIRRKALWEVEHAFMSGMDKTLAGSVMIVIGAIG